MLAGPLLLQVVLTTKSAAMPADTFAAAIAEAAAIWAPHRVVVDGAGPRGAPAGAVVLTVEVVGRAPQRVPLAGPALGAIHFDAAGHPQPVVTLLLGEIARFVVGARLLGLNERFWPAWLRAQVMGRVAGRVLAHEIGHYLLQSPQHSRSGLMRAGQSADDFVSPDRNLFSLPAETAARLADAAKSEGPARAGPSSQMGERR